MSVRRDLLKYALIVNVASLLLACITAAWENAASRNLSLATGTLAAVAINFLIQLPFELQGSKDLDHVSTESTIDRGVPSIRQWNYTGTPGWRIGIETGASSWLAAARRSSVTATSRIVMFSSMSAKR